MLMMPAQSAVTIFIEFIPLRYFILKLTNVYRQPQQMLLVPSTHATYFVEHVLTGLTTFVVVDRMLLLILIHV